VGYTIGGGSDPLKASLLFLGAAMLGAWGNIINDFFDLRGYIDVITFKRHLEKALIWNIKKPNP
jgi:1,4-dihydroxy-2-naphthoate octaprenyltransferase